MSQEIQRHQPETGAIQHQSVNPIHNMMQKFTENATPENVAAMKELAALYLSMEKEGARKQFFEAKRALQADLPRVMASKAVNNSESKGGGVRYVFAPFEDIMGAVQPYLDKHGFSISFSQEVEDNRITAICILSHDAGHSEANRFAVRAGNGPPGCNEAQADGASSTYAKRFALCNCLNITIEKDQDARVLGDHITAQQAGSLQERVAATGSDMSKFLKYAKAESFETIRTGMYSQLDAFLMKKERPVAAKQIQPEPIKNTAPGATGRATEVLTPEGATTNAPSAVSGEPSTDEQKRIIAEETAEEFAEKAVQGGNKTIIAAYGGLGPRALQDAVSEIHPPTANARTPEDHKKILRLAKYKSLTQ